MGTSPPTGPGVRRRWRVLAPLAFVLAGGLFVSSAITAQGTDLRAGRYDDLSGLANAESAHLTQLQGQVAALNADVNSLTENRATRTEAERLQTEVARLSGPAGLDPVQGPGVQITLDDAPKAAQQAAQETGAGDVSDLLVHQQDIQAVANALWSGGAEAMTIQGKRVISTTGIKCVGNTVVLNGVPYSPPYRIAAIGPQSQMLSSVRSSPYIQIYLEVVRTSGLGWSVAREAKLAMAGFTGVTELQYAAPLEATPRPSSGSAR